MGDPIYENKQSTDVDIGKQSNKSKGGGILVLNPINSIEYENEC